MLTATISDFRKDIKKYLDKVSEYCETLIINRGKGRGIVIMSLHEYNSLIATSHEMSSKANEKRLDSAIESLQVAEKQIVYGSYRKLDKNAVNETISGFLKKDGRISKAWIFGSFARGEDDNKSDIDLMIEVPEDSKFSLFDLADIQYQLEKLVPKKVDIVMNEAVNLNVMNRIKPDLKLIYER